MATTAFQYHANRTKTKKKKMSIQHQFGSSRGFDKRNKPEARRSENSWRFNEGLSDDACSLNSRVMSGQNAHCHDDGSHASCKQGNHDHPGFDKCLFLSLV